MNVLEKILEEIDTIKKEYDNEKYHQYFVDGANCVISDIRALIRSQMDDVHDINVGKWIPVSERLPQENKYCLITVETTYFLGRHEIHIRTAKMENKKWFEEKINGKVTAWMPLPEPYEVGGLMMMDDHKETSVCDDCDMRDGLECQFCCQRCYEVYGQCPNPDCDPMDI